MRNNINKYFKKKILFKFGLLSIFIFSVSIEITAKYILGLGNPPLFIQHKSIEYEYVPNQNLKRFHRHIKINSMGMRSEEFSQNSSKKRILVYGDSIVWGGTITDQKDLSTEVLGKLLEENNYN